MLQLFKIFSAICLAITSVAVAGAATTATTACDQKAGDPSYHCLPDRLPYDFPAGLRAYVPIPTSSQVPPIVSEMRAEDPSNPEPAGGFVDQFGPWPWFKPSIAPLIEATFPAEEYVKLPGHQSIHAHPGITQSFLNPAHLSHETVWIYPTGIEIVHRVFYWKDNRLILLETRVLRLLPSGHWAAGAYGPDPANAHYLKLRATAPKPVHVQVTLTKNFDVRFIPVGTESCRLCHSAHGQVEGQMAVGRPASEREELAGPCEFGPHFDPTALMAWEKEFFNRFGYWPVKTIR